MSPRKKIKSETMKEHRTEPLGIALLKDSVKKEKLAEYTE